MPRVGISYRPAESLFYSGWNQTALVLSELYSALGHEIILVDGTNSDASWWDDITPRYTTANLYQTTGLDLLIDIDGLIDADARVKASRQTVIFLRTYLQFAEMDSSVYIESPYVPRSMKNVHEIWCWDILNPENTIPSIQTLFPCPIRRVPFIWSPFVVEHYAKETPTCSTDQPWTIHVAEKNKENTSSSVLPLVAIRELCQKKVLNAKYLIHNMEVIKDNRFLKENILNNIESETLPLDIVPKEPFYQWLGTNHVLLSHSRFTYLRIGLLNAIWLGIPVIHNSYVIRDLHASLKNMFYIGNEIRGIERAFSSFVTAPDVYYSARSDIRSAILSRYGIDHQLESWRSIVHFEAPPTTPPLPSTPPPTPILSPKIESYKIDRLIIAFSDMWPGFNFDHNFMTDALRHHTHAVIKGMAYDPSIVPDLVIFGPYSEHWRSIPASIPKVFFTAEHWKAPADPSIALYLTSSRDEDSTHFRLPAWMTFIDWYSGATTLPTNTEDNPIRIPVHFATTSHSVSFHDRTQFCGFVVSNPICQFRNQTFERVNSYKKVNSGGALYNNIGQPLELKYPGGGCGDLSKHRFFSDHQFTISFENAQIPGYITEKVLHAKMAGCVPLYWGDVHTDTDFVPNSFLNLSAVSNPDIIVEVIKKLEENPAMCSMMAATPILDTKKKEQALDLLSRMCEKLLSIVSRPSITPEVAMTALPTFIEGIEKTYVINLDTRADRWNSLLEAEPYLERLVERIPGVNGKTLDMNSFIYNLFEKNEFNWKKSIIGCNLSHISVWSKIAVATEGNYFLVLEDDVRFQPGWLDRWKQCLPHIPADAELLYLGGVLPPNKAALPMASAPYNEHWSMIQPNTMFSPAPAPVFHFCAYSYILTRGGAQKLMNYLFHSDRRSFTVSDHLLGHPSIGLTKYFVTPLLSYCFQESDPVYVQSDFNDLHRNDKFDSDIWNNTECFTKAELAPFQTPSDSSQIVYFFPKEGETSVEPYEKQWLEHMLCKTLRFVPVSNQMVIGCHLLFLVQRPHVDQCIHLFRQLEENQIPFKVIHLSDEFETDDISFYSYSMCKAVLRNYPRGPMPSHVLTIPLGYHHRSTEPTKSFLDRELLWSFHGTDWFDRSKQLSEWVSFVPHYCHLQPHWNHPSATKEGVYVSILENSKFCPILKGQNVETFRLYEALEAGCLPVTNLTDSAYLSWIDQNLGLSSFYEWTNPVAIFNGTTIDETVRQQVGERWNAWKQRIHESCFDLFG